MILVFHNINFKKFVQLRYFSRSYRSNKKLITINEYQRQGDIETRKALEELRKYCLSPECNAWKVMCQLKEPIRYFNKLCSLFLIKHLIIYLLTIY